MPGPGPYGNKVQSLASKKVGQGAKGKKWWDRFGPKPLGKPEHPMWAYGKKKVI